MISCGQSKISEFAGHALVSDENVFRLQIPVVDPDGVAVLDGIQDLEKGALDEIFIADILALLGDVGKQVTFWAVFHYDISAVRSVHNLDQRDYVWVCTSLVVKLYLPLLEFPLARLKADLVECLHGIRDVGLDVHGSVNNSICTYSEDSSELKPSSKNLS
jgi:hypothetical protein